MVVEGGPEGVDDVPDDAEIRELAMALLGGGMPPSGVAKELARQLGMPRNDAYRIVHELESNTA